MSASNSLDISRRCLLRAAPFALAVAPVAVAQAAALAQAPASASTVRALVARQRAAMTALETKADEADYSDEEMAPWVEAYGEALEAVFCGLVLSAADAQAALGYVSWYSEDFEFGNNCRRLLAEIGRFLGGQG